MRSPSAFLFSTLLVSALFTACTSARHIAVQLPAEVAVPATAQRVVLVDRTMARSGFSNAFESMTSRESGMDEELGQNMNTVLKEALDALGHFEVVVEHGRFEGSGTGVLPEPMSWDTIVQVCSRNQADVLVALEALDTDVNIDVQERTVQESSNGQPTGPARVEFQAKRKITLKFGWRVYDRRAQIIADMFDDKSVVRDEFIGQTKSLAKQGFPDKRAIVEEMAKTAARTYARRFVPTSATVKRIVYSAGDRRLSAANDLTLRNDWPGAIHIWESMLADPQVKLRGKACYNMAVAYEVMGDLPKARDLARRSGTEFGNKWGSGYAAELDVRMKGEARAAEERERIKGVE